MILKAQLSLKRCVVSVSPLKRVDRIVDCCLFVVCYVRRLLMLTYIV